MLSQMAHGLPEYLTLHAAASNFLYPHLILTRWVLFSCAIALLTACAAPLAVLSSSGTTAASAVGTAAVANPGTAASLASTVATGKSPLEHAASAATKKECSFFNVLGSQPICVEVVLPTVTDNSQPFFGPADISTETAKQ